MLVSAIMPIMSIYRLPLGQYGYTGHVINLPQDVISFADSLPRLPSELDILVVRKEQDQPHHDFRVRCTVVQEALEWLLQNNKYKPCTPQSLLLLLGCCSTSRFSSWFLVIHDFLGLSKCYNTYECSTHVFDQVFILIFPVRT